MNILVAAIILTAAQAAPNTAGGHSHGSTHPPCHSENSGHSKAQPERKCCIEVDGRMECQMMKGRHSDNPARVSHDTK